MYRTDTDIIAYVNVPSIAMPMVFVIILAVLLLRFCCVMVNYLWFILSWKFLMRWFVWLRSFIKRSTSYTLVALRIESV